MFSTYFIHLAVIITIFIILAVSLNLVLGYTGMINLGHIAFYGIGAYASAILTISHQFNFLLAVFCGGLIASACGWFLTVITNRLKGDYFALGTMGFSFVSYAFFLNWTSLTRGPLGIPGIPRPKIFGYIIRTNGEYLLFSLLVAILVILFLYLLTRSRYGKLLEAVRDDVVGVQMLGKNIFRLKYQAMMISAFIAAIAGALYGHYISFIDPSTFYLNDIVIVLTIVIVGGLASLRGSIVGALIITLIPEALRFVQMPPSMIGPMRQIVYALLLILILMYRPKGLFGRVDLE
ncbi:MAG: branched-chain amino acid ABC transporter permease [Candidatus Magasanikbacteria bacterium CG11_big_fil_rev_8_21_14_0_20_39_34]|uniref:Branched-chain amino acid ABC transporter permease n=1 Tax=Candidatus Magasanikbacteria bacterium CG11_big_fil_rev_8_21_14_0_20_39_34 TaxID=1974653 RepID=A0A2H0N6C6_9BACT|nr:MAG: branched-chain amino acid ABC transporter permease [Candidatus Magasanikbacteria bacterium CG11_big_fil_rev_8_21_14_0_20_39_34]